MRTITERFFDALERQLAEITLNGESLTQQYKASVLVCKKAMNKLKNYTSSYAFTNPEEEIHFFKVVKPKFYSKYIYYINLYNYLMKKPPGGDEVQRAYITWHLTELKNYFDHNQAFYQYYRSNATQLDGAYFTRGGFDVHVELEDFEEDEQYSTSHDYKISKLMANEKFQDYLNLEILRIGNEDLVAVQGHRIFPFKHLEWTATQTDAIEILYSLKTASAVNHGNIDIAELVAVWEFIFQIEINESYHKLLDIRRRKKDPLIFLTRLRSTFEHFLQGTLGILMILGLSLSLLVSNLKPIKSVYQSGIKAPHCRRLSSSR